MAVLAVLVLSNIGLTWYLLRLIIDLEKVVEICHSQLDKRIVDLEDSTIKQIKTLSKEIVVKNVLNIP